MKITATARMKGENEVTVRISAAFKGAENATGEAQAKAQLVFRANYGDSLNAGFTWDASNMAYTITVPATPEACAPIAAFVEKHGLEIIQM